MQFTIRLKQDDDEDFIYSTWLKSYKSDSIQGRRTRSHIFFENHHPIVEATLKRAVTHIACWEKDPQVIAGYLTHEKGNGKEAVLHYAFTKQKFRRLGVLRSLLAEAGVLSDMRPEFTHWTDSMNHLILKNPGWLYNPYLAR